LETAREALTPDEEQDLVLQLVLADLTTHLDAYVTKHRQQVVAALENWWDKYAISFDALEADRADTAAALSAALRSLGYAS
jgi:type I restriction enzyme M protein